jgi:serine/threonine protein kinase
MSYFKKWQLNKVLVCNSKTTIYNVEPKFDFEDNTNEELKNDILSTKWVLKYTSHWERELRIINQLKLYENDELFIKMPKDKIFRGEIFPSFSYFVMEKYDSTIRDNFKFARENLKKLGKYLIDVLSFLHLKLNKIHGDIKCDNILIKYSKSQPFILMDYECIKEPDEVLCQSELPEGYYYYYLGCYFDKPHFSYRSDLQTVGYLFYSLAMSTHKEYVITSWQNYAMDFYNEDLKKNDFEFLETIRKNDVIKEFLTKNEYKDMIVSYFDIIEKQDWYGNPNPEVYEKLQTLFKI